MNTILIANSAWCLPLLLELNRKKFLKGLVITHFDHEANRQIQSFAEADSIPLIRIGKDNLEDLYQNMLVLIHYFGC